MLYHSGNCALIINKVSRNSGYGIGCGLAFPHDYYGIRPAFYLDESNAEILSGSGTAEAPYVVDGKKKHEIRVYLNGAEVLFDQPPVTEADRTLVPIRAIAEAMGADVGWEEESRTAEIRFGVQTVRFQIDNPVMKRNGEEVWLEAPPRQIGDRTLVPLRALAEGFGATVDWDEGTKTVSISWQ